MLQTRLLQVPGPLLLMLLVASSPTACAAGASAWQVGTPIVTYWAGPDITDAVAEQMREAGFNLIWCREAGLDVAQRHGLRAYLWDPLFSGPGALATLDDPAKTSALSELIQRVKAHPALYAYHLKDEPGAEAFPGWASLADFIRQRDPDHLIFMNLFPTYATNEQLGTAGDLTRRYREYLRQYIEALKPRLLSYDHYHFAVGGLDAEQYFQNLALVRESALAARLPFMQIVQACSWSPSWRIPDENELRFLVYTTLAYGAQGIAYYVYRASKHQGGMLDAEGQTTPGYAAVKALNPEFVAIARELQPIQSLGAYHVGMLPQGAEYLPSDTSFSLDPPVAPLPYQQPERVQGLLLGLFGAADEPTSALVVNLDYRMPRTVTLVGPASLQVFEAATGAWAPSPGGRRATLELLPGGGKLVRLGSQDTRGPAGE